MEQLKYLVTGTGRCGTVYTAKLLTSIGIPCSHEGIFSHEGIEKALNSLANKDKIRSSYRSNEYEFFNPSGNELRAESSYMAAPFLDHECLKHTKIIHIVRHPINVIFSFIKDFSYFQWKEHEESKTYELFIRTHLPEIDETENPILRAVIYYVKWNAMIQEYCKNKKHIFCRIEDGPEQIFDFLGLKAPKKFFKDKKSNTRKHRIAEETLDDIPDGTIKNMLLEKMNEYGYETKIQSNKRLFL